MQLSYILQCKRTYIKYNLMATKNKKSYLDEKINEQYEEINEFLVEIDKKINEIVQGNEKDFLVAFRAIMIHVNEEMKKLKEISDEQALMAKRNNALNDLKSALSWFQSEAVKLSEACSEIQEKYDINKQKIHALETENTHLEKLVETYSEDNQRLKQEFFSKSELKFEGSEGSKYEKDHEFPLDTLQEIIQSYGIENNELIQSLQSYLQDKIDLKEKALEHKANIKRKQQKKLKKILEIKQKISSQQSDFENLFSECVQKVTEEAFHRRSTQTTGKYQSNEKFNLTAADKRKVLEYFITKPQVYTILSEKLFPDSLSKFPRGKEGQDQTITVKSMENISDISILSQNLFKDLI